MSVTRHLPTSGDGSLAPAGLRLAAAAIDLAVLALPLGLVYATGIRAGRDTIVFPTEPTLAMYAGWVVVICLYHGIAVARTGRTVGKRALGLRVVPAGEAAAVDGAHALIRVLIPLAVWLVPFRGIQLVGVLAVTLIWANFNADLQGVHDLAAGTVVVRDSD